MIFVGVASGDTEADTQYLAQRAVNPRIFSDEAGKFNLSVLDVNEQSPLTIVHNVTWATT